MRDRMKRVTRKWPKSISGWRKCAWMRIRISSKNMRYGLGVGVNVIIKRGDIFYSDLSPVIGSEQGGVRPVLIVQNDIGNKYSPTVIAAANYITD